MALNNDSTTDTVTVPVWPLSLTNGITATNLPSGLHYTVQNGRVCVGVNGHHGAIRAP